MSDRPVLPLLDRSREAVLRAATQLLIENPGASLAELAASIGIGRTTLHRHFRDRAELVAAIAGQALDDLEQLYADCGLVLGAELATARATATATATATTTAGQQALKALLAAAERLIPLGPSLMFLLRDPDIAGHHELTARAERLDRPLHAAAATAAAAGLLDPSVPSWWAIETLYATVWVAWEQIEAGRLANRDAPALVHRTWLTGTAGR